MSAWTPLVVEPTVPIDDWLAEEGRRVCRSSEAFFVRWSEPSPHLRWRVRGHVRWPDMPRCVVRPGTYVPEVDRFGGAAVMRASQALFIASSRAAIEILAGVRAGGLAVATSALLAVLRDLRDGGPAPPHPSWLRSWQSACRRFAREIAALPAARRDGVVEVHVHLLHNRLGASSFEELRTSDLLARALGRAGDAR